MNKMQENFVLVNKYKAKLCLYVGGADVIFGIKVRYSKLPDGRVFVRSIKNSTGIEFIGAIDEVTAQSIVQEIERTLAK